MRPRAITAIGASAAVATVAIVAVVGVATSCDPVNDAQRDALGGETAGLPPGPDHRPGQPCVVCHASDFAVAGTVYGIRPSDDEPAPTRGVPDVDVTLTDSAGSSITKTTRSTGNFYVLLREWRPTWPVKVRIESNGVLQNMTTQIGEQGSCGACHTHPSSASSPGYVYLVDPNVDGGKP